MTATENQQAKLVYQHTSGVSTLRYQAASHTLFCGTEDGRILGLDAADNFQKFIDVETGLKSVTGLDVHATDPLVAVSGMAPYPGTGTYQIWDVARRVRLLEQTFLSFGGNDSCCLRFLQPPPGSPPSDWALFGSFSDYLALNVRTGETRELFFGSDYNTWITFHPSGNFGVVSCLEPQDCTFVGAFSFDPDTNTAVPYVSPRIRMDPEEGAPPELTTDVPLFCEFSPAGDWLVTSWANLGMIKTRAEIEEQAETEGWAKTEELEAPIGFVSVFSFPECELLRDIVLSGRLEEMVEYEGRDPETGESVPGYGPPGFVTNLVLLGAQGGTAACGLPTGHLVLVDWVEGKVKHKALLHKGEVSAVERLSATQVASCGLDGRVMLLDAAAVLPAKYFELPVAADVFAAEALRQANMHKQAFLEVAVAGDGSFHDWQ